MAGSNPNPNPRRCYMQTFEFFNREYDCTSLHMRETFHVLHQKSRILQEDFPFFWMSDIIPKILNLLLKSKIPQYAVSIIHGTTIEKGFSPK